MTPLPIPYGEPAAFVAGDTVQFYRRFARYPIADGWVLSYSLVPRSVIGTRVDSVGGWFTNDGALWTVTIPPSATGPMAPGQWDWAAYVTQGGDRRTAETGRFLIERNLAQAAPGAYLSDNEKMLAAVKAEMSARLTGDGSALNQYAIGDRHFGKLTWAELRAYKGVLQALVYQERNPGKFGRDIVDVYTRPGRSRTAAVAETDDVRWTG